MPNAIKLLRPIGVHDLGVARAQGVGDVIHGVVGRPPGPESLAVLTEVGCKDRFDDEFRRHLRDPIAQRRYPERALTAIRFES